MNRRTIHEQDIRESVFPDRWSKDLVSGSAFQTTSGFSLGVAEYHSAKFGVPQKHDDQEALYVIRGIGEVLIGVKVYPVQPGTAVYIPPSTEHATRRTETEPVRVVYAHGAV